MAYLIALGILALLGIVSTLWLLRTDGYGSVAVDPSRVVEPDPPADAAEAPAERAEKRRVPRRILVRRTT